MFFYQFLLGMTLSLCLFAQAANGSRCAHVFQKKTEFPKELKLHGELLNEMLSGPHAQTVHLTGRMFQALLEDNVLTQIAYSFRNFPWEEHPQDTSSMYPQFIFELNKLVTNNELTPERSIEAWNIFSAIQQNVDPGHLLRDERILLSYLLTPLIKKSHFSRLNNSSEASIQTRLENFDGASHTNFINIHKHRVAFEKLITDLGIRVFFEKMMFNQSIFSDVIAHKSLTDLIFALRSKRFHLKTDIKSKYIVGISLILLTRASFKESDTSQLYDLENKYTDKNYREMLLNNMEEFLLDRLENPELVSPVIDILDNAEFNTPFALNDGVLKSHIIDYAKRFITPIKKIAQENKILPQENTTKNLFTPLAKSDVKPVDQFPIPAQSKKRKSKRVSLSEPEEQISDNIKINNENLLRDVKTPTPLRTYTFSMLRQPHFGRQSIEFSEDAITPFQNATDIGFASFSKAIRYGFTARDSSNGIKRLGINQNLSENYYEVRPGFSRFRIILKRNGTHWIAIKTLHKDKVDRFLEGL